MNQQKQASYTRLMFYVFILIRALSEFNKTHIWKPCEWIRLYRNIKKIYKISDAFHDLPNLIYDHNFDENHSWTTLLITLPSQAEYLREDFEELMQDYFDFSFDLLEPWMITKRIAPGS